MKLGTTHYRRLIAWSAASAIVALSTAATTSIAAAGSSGNNDIGSSNFTLSGRTPASPSNFDVTAAGEDPGLFQQSLENIGLGGLMQRFGIRVNGYAEVGLVYNFDRPVQGSNGPSRLFDDKSEDPRIDQLSISVERELQVNGDRFDMGFKVQTIYGADARFTQANGTNFYGSGYAGKRDLTFIPFNNGQISPFVDEVGFPGQEFPENQIDVLQAYLTMNLPWGHGVSLTGGKFVTPWGMETVDPTMNQLYSHSYIFAASQPKTLTGLTAGYRLDDQWRVMGGVVVGWDQSLNDNNDTPSLVAQVGYQSTEDLNFIFSGMVGPEQEDNSSDTRWLLDGTMNWRADRLTNVGVEGVIGYEPDTGTRRSRAIPGQPKFLEFTGDNSLWFGIAAYGDYKVDYAGRYVLHARGEYFNDCDGGRLIATEVFEVTFGVTLRPWVNDNIWKNLAIRPEVRWDYSSADIFDGNNTRNGQITVGADLIFSF